ncbi:MAG: HAD-IIA family hydrolase [Halanaerobiaceae bacterium]
MLEDVALFMFDMDGTFYLGNELLPGADVFLKKLQEQKKEYVFLTNNSSRAAADYQLKLSRMGLNVPLERIITSGEVTASYIEEKNAGANVYVVGTKSLQDVFATHDFEIKDNKDEEIEFLILGFDTSLTYKKLWDAHDLILQGVEYIATNPDYVCPLPEGRSMPDCGSFIQLLKTSTGREPYVVGKPNPLMVDYIARKFEIKKDNIAMVGDRLYTDIRMASEAGITGILVLSGETDSGMLKEATEQPDLVLSDVTSIADRL